MGPVYRKSQRGVFLRDSSFQWGQDLRVTNPDRFSFQEGDWFTARVESYTESSQELSGALLKKMGDMKEPSIDIHRVLFLNQISEGFSSEAIKEAKECRKKSFSEKKKTEGI